jgi:hypothetical protein
MDGRKHEVATSPSPQTPAAEAQKTIAEEPPPRPQDYPSPDAMPDAPKREDVNRYAASPQKAAFGYKNSTKERLTLLVFDWQQHFFPATGPIIPDAWHTWELPPSGELAFIKNFLAGYYTMYVRPSGTEARHYLGTYLIAYSERPTLEIVAGNSAKPFIPIFQSSESHAEK